VLREKKFYLTEKGPARIKKECERLKKIKFAKTKGESPVGSAILGHKVGDEIIISLQ